MTAAVSTNGMSDIVGDVKITDQDGDTLQFDIFEGGNMVVSTPGGHMVEVVADDFKVLLEAYQEMVYKSAST